jgi:putative membrane protein
MFVNYKGSILGLVRWQWKPFLLFVFASTAIVFFEDRVPLWVVDMTQLPTLPLAVVGGAIGIFVSFRTNAGYDRWWEGRKLWGRLVNVSRHFASQVLAYLPADGDSPSELQKGLIRRQILYVHVLRCLLRQEDPWKDEDVRAFVEGDERAVLRGRSNVTHAILDMQFALLRDENDAKRLADLRLHSMDQTIFELLSVQGGCERIKKTPFPRGYGFIAERLILAYGLILPFGLVESMGWMTVPMTVLVCMGFLLISEVGRVLEDPFTLFWPALPLFALSKTIEANLRDLLGERNLPPLPVPNARGILM